MGIVRRLLGKVRGEPSDPPQDSGAPPVPDDWNDVVRERPTAAAECTVRFNNPDVSILVARNTALLDAAIGAGIDLNHYCGGMCSCGSCRLVVVSGDVSAMDGVERTTLQVVRETEADRLGCQTLVLGDVVVEVPEP